MFLILDQLLYGFSVNGFWSAMFFGIIVSLVTSFLEALAGNRDEQ